MANEPQKKAPPVKPSAKVYPSDLRYFEERIGELNNHAIIHEGELCSKLARARIGGMIEVLNRIGLEVETSWTVPCNGVWIGDVLDFLKSRELLKRASDGE